MVGVHMRNGALFRLDQRGGIRQIGQHLGGTEIGGTGKAAVEMRRCNVHAPEGEIAEAGIELRLRDGAPGSGGGCGRSSAPSRSTGAKAPSTVSRGCARASPLPVLGQQQRGAAVELQIGGVGGQLRHQDQRRAVGIGGDIDQRGKGVAGIAVQRRQRPGAGRAQQGLGHRHGRTKSAGGGALSGMRPGMAPGRGFAGLSHCQSLSGYRVGFSRHWA